MSVKIFGIGTMKTGTSSLGHFLERNGLKKYEDWTMGAILEDPETLLKSVNKYEVFEDFPWQIIYKEAYRIYPDAYFILTVRDSPEEWFNSMYRHVLKDGPNQQSKHFYGYYCPSHKNREDFIRQYIDNNAEIIDFFSNKPGKLLVLPTSEPNKVKKLEEFLQMRFIKCKEYPHSNAQKKIEENQSFPVVYSEEISHLLFEVKDAIIRGKVDYTKLNPTVYKIEQSSLSEEAKNKTKMWDYFIKFILNLASKLDYSPIIVYFIENFNIDHKMKLDKNKRTLKDYAKWNRNKKLMSYLKQLDP
jgi:hypothetical protein